MRLSQSAQLGSTVYKIHSNTLINHCCDVKWASTHLISLISPLFVQQFLQAGNKGNFNTPHHWPFVRGKAPITDGFPHNGPVLLKAFPCHDIIISIFITVHMICIIMYNKLFSICSWPKSSCFNYYCQNGCWFIVSFEISKTVVWQDPGPWFNIKMSSY